MKLKLLLLTFLASLITVSCYKFTLIEQPHEATTNSVFKGKVVVKRSGASDNGSVLHIYGLFGICVPEGWLADGDLVMTQVPKPTTDVGDEYKNVITRRLVPNEKYTALLNECYPKTGYTWLGFMTDRDFKSLFNTSTPEVEIDSIYAEFSIRTNDKTGTFYLDYIAGHASYDKADDIGGEERGNQTHIATFAGDNIGNVTFADTHITVTRPDGSMDNTTAGPDIKPEWDLELMPDATRPGAALAYKDWKYNKLFTRTRGWNGGDGVLTVGLPDGSVFWTFNDSFYGSVNAADRSRGDCNFPRNSVMLQKATDGVLGETDKDFIWLADYVNWTDPSAEHYFHCRTHLRHPDGEKTVDEILAGDIDQDRVYWSGDGTIYDGKLQMLWMGTASKELRALGTSIATYSLDGTIPEGYYLDDIPDYLPKKGNYLYREKVTHQINDNAVSYGSTLCEADDGHTYLYGTNGYGVLVARTATHDLYSKWQYYGRLRLRMAGRISHSRADGTLADNGEQLCLQHAVGVQGRRLLLYDGAGTILLTRGLHLSQQVALRSVRRETSALRAARTARQAGSYGLSLALHGEPSSGAFACGRARVHHQQRSGRLLEELQRPRQRRLLPSVLLPCVRLEESVRR